MVRAKILLGRTTKHPGEAARYDYSLLVGDRDRVEIRGDYIAEPSKDVPPLITRALAQALLELGVREYEIVNGERVERETDEIETCEALTPKQIREFAKRLEETKHN